jgi:hypothetical protein
MSLISLALKIAQRLGEVFQAIIIQHEYFDGVLA